MSAQALRTFLEDPGRPPGTLKYHELQGFLFAVASAPDLVPPSEWMPIVFGDQEPEYENLAEAKAVLTELMALYNRINAAVAEQPTLPPDCTLHDDPLANLDEDAPIALWSRGLLRGHQWLSESWEPYIPKEFDEGFAAVLMTLTFFSSNRLAEAYREETKASRLADVAATICRVFPGAVAEYAQLGRSIHRVINEAERSQVGERLKAKAGRNDPCPCGSGKKFKRCCGQ